MVFIILEQAKSLRPLTWKKTRPNTRWCLIGPPWPHSADFRLGQKASSFESMNTDIYYACITILYMQRICITPVLLYAIKYVNVGLCKSVDLV